MVEADHAVEYYSQVKGATMLFEVSWEAANKSMFFV
jgi:hypothetical protein